MVVEPKRPGVGRGAEGDWEVVAAEPKRDLLEFGWAAAGWALKLKGEAAAAVAAGWVVVEPKPAKLGLEPKRRGRFPRSSC